MNVIGVESQIRGNTVEISAGSGTIEWICSNNELIVSSYDFTDAVTYGGTIVRLTHKVTFPQPLNNVKLFDGIDEVRELYYNFPLPSPLPTGDQGFFLTIFDPYYGTNVYLSESSGSQSMTPSGRDAIKCTLSASNLAAANAVLWVAEIAAILSDGTEIPCIPTAESGAIVETLP